jgi:segregation and condensation protein A
MNISKLPVYTMEEAIKKITSLLKELTDWRDIKDVVPGSFSGSKNLRKSGLAGTFAGSLELVREGKLAIMQKKNFDKILIKAK